MRWAGPKVYGNHVELFQTPDLLWMKFPQVLLFNNMLLCRVLSRSPLSSIAPYYSALSLSPSRGAIALNNVRGRGFHTSSHVMGLEEFFPKTTNIIEESEKTGDP